MLIVSGTGLTDRTKLSFAVNEPSLTVTVMVALPTTFDTGVTVTVRFDPKPPNTMLLVGTNDGFEELAERVRLLAETVALPMVKGIAAVGVFTGVLWLAMSLIVGAVLPPLVLIIKLQPAMVPKE